MSAPSFSSFQPSFSSFPEQASSSKVQDSSRSRKSKDKPDKDRKDRKDSATLPTGHRHHDEPQAYRSKEHRRKDRDSDKKHGRKHGHNSSDSGDERKARKHSRRSNGEDSTMRSGHFSHDRDGSRLFFEDRIGDSLNVKYGGLHAGDISAYRRIAGKYHLHAAVLLLNDDKEEERSWALTKASSFSNMKANML